MEEHLDNLTHLFEILFDLFRVCGSFWKCQPWEELKVFCMIRGPYFKEMCARRWDLAQVHFPVKQSYYI